MHGGGVTPEQIDAVETTMASLPFDELADRFYAHLFTLDPAVRSMFPADLDAQRRKFGAELALIVSVIRRHDDFVERIRRLAVVHRQHGVRHAHVRAGGAALIAALADVLGPAWTPSVASSWARAYALTMEAMQVEMARR